MKIAFTLLASLFLGIGSLHATDDSHNRIIEMRHENFQDLMHFSNPVIIDVYSNRCVYCKRLEPIFKKLNKELGSNYQFVKLSLDNEPQIVDSFNVRGFPTILFFQNGKEVGRHVGFMNEQTFRSEIEKYFGKNSD